MTFHEKRISFDKLILPVISAIFLSLIPTSALATDTDTVVVDVDLTNSVVS